MKRKAIILILALLLLSRTSIRAEDCEEIAGDTIETWIELDCDGMKPGETRSKVSNGVTTKYTMNPDGTVTTVSSSNKAVEPGSLLTNSDVFKDHEVSDTHTGTGDNINYHGSNLGTTDSSEINISGKGFKVESTATPSTETMTTAILNTAAELAGRDKLNTSDPKSIEGFLVSQGHKPGTSAFNQMMNRIKGKSPAGLRKEGNKFKGDQVIIIAIKFKVPPTKVCKEDDPEQPCKDYNSLGQPEPVYCNDGTVLQGHRAQCNVYNTKDPISSYTTTSPNYSDPMIRNRDICNPSDIADGKKPLMYTLKAAGNIKANSRVMQDKLLALPKLFDENHWTTTWQSESRYWNPFQEGVIVPGLPIKEHFSPVLDSWRDKEEHIDSALTDSLRHVGKAEGANNNFSANYGGKNINVYSNAPNPTVTFRYLDNGKWRQDSSPVKECVSQYQIKTFPRLDITVHTRYQKYKLNLSQGSYDWSCNCTAVYEDYWSDFWQEWRERIDHWDCNPTTYNTDISVKVPDGESQSTSPGGSIPPVYKDRVVWRYRIGTVNEFHTYAKNVGKPTLKAVPSRSTTKIKSGYGTNYGGDKFKVITDYDTPQFKLESDLVRPNKNIPITLSNSLKSKTKDFDPNVKYDPGADAPERSSSKDSTYINERIDSKKIGSNFKKDAISKYVSNSLSGSYGAPKPNSGNSSIRNGQIYANGSKIDMSTTFESKSGNKYYHAFWKTKGHPNLIPAFKPGPLHYINLDYPSGSMYDIYSMNRVIIRDGFTIDTFNKGSIKVLGNMWEDSFSRPDSEKNITYIYI